MIIIFKVFSILFGSFDSNGFRYLKAYCHISRCSVLEDRGYCSTERQIKPSLVFNRGRNPLFVVDGGVVTSI